MKFHALLDLPLSADGGWPQLIEDRPDPVRLFGAVVLPLSLVPPVILYLVGTHQTELFTKAFGHWSWGALASLFFVAEMTTILLLGWFLRHVADTHKLELRYGDAYLLAAIAPIPMWLSALGLLIPDLLLAASIALVGLGLTCGILYHGILSLCRTRDAIVAVSIVHTVIGACLAAWIPMLLLALT